MKRLTGYASLSNTLARLTDEELSALVAETSRLHAGGGGRSVLLSINSTPIFVKMIPLTDLERRQEHVRSTANLFDIPLSCHYGLGGPGFSAWRELAATAHVVLFCEYMPQTLLDWLSEQVHASEEAAETAIAFVDAHLAPTASELARSLKPAARSQSQFRGSPEACSQ
ncbi:MAG: hypothetical protein AB7F99_05915 [Vicinamibacterales bacterium]